MLFLGTEKYPEEGSYQAFLSEHGGSSNAYTSMALTAAAAAVVVVLNVALSTVLKALTELERHDCQSDETASASLKLFFTTFINTALVVLLVNAHLVNEQGDDIIRGT